MYFDFLYNVVWKTAHFKKNSARYDQSVHWTSCKVSVIVARF